jgi:predicted nucleic acid-binding protein
VILYLDSSAIVKRYVTEAHSKAVRTLMDEATASATTMVSRVEVAAALARAVRLKALSPVAGRNAHRRFAGEWPDFVRIPVTEVLVARADALAWEHGLRGYDAVQLASALVWQDAIGRDVVFATFDQALMDAAVATGLQGWPDVW